MSIQRFKSLLFRSTKIQKEIEREHQSRWPNWLRLLKLKKLRLAIKDSMERLVHEGAHGRFRLTGVKSRRLNKNDWQSA
jgi:uncharacterized protein YdcH (DUF465 family)